MSDAEFRNLCGQVTQLVAHLQLTWAPCPRNFAQYSEEERDKFPHAFPTCSDGLLKDGYDQWVCDTCHGAGEVLVKLSEPNQKDQNE
jgi:hypothetical protein